MDSESIVLEPGEEEDVDYGRLDEYQKCVMDGIDASTDAPSDIDCRARARSLLGELMELVRISMPSKREILSETPHRIRVKCKGCGQLAGVRKFDMRIFQHRLPSRDICSESGKIWQPEERH